MYLNDNEKKAREYLAIMEVNSQDPRERESQVALTDKECQRLADDPAYEYSYEELREIFKITLDFSESEHEED